jgi:hypothetical protein
MTDLTQYHEWGTNRLNESMIHSDTFSDEYFWEFATIEEVMLAVIPIDHMNAFLASGGALVLKDTPNPVPRFHKLQVWAYHPKESMITWISLAKNVL